MHNSKQFNLEAIDKDLGPVQLKSDWPTYYCEDRYCPIYTWHLMKQPETSPNCIFITNLYSVDQHKGYHLHNLDNEGNAYLFKLSGRLLLEPEPLSSTGCSSPVAFLTITSASEIK